MIKYVLILFFLVTSCSVTNTIPKEFKAKVIKVRDGDTVEVLYRKQTVVIRLEHVDCPERKQPYHKRAKKFTSEFCFDKRVKIVSKGKYDRYKRLIAEIVINKKILNQELVKNGYALHYKRYSKDKEYANLEDEAHKEKVGMWSQEKLIAPWLYRKNRKKKK